MSDGGTKKLSRFEKGLGITTAGLTALTLFLGWRTHQLNTVTAENEVEIRELAARVSTERLGFDRFRDTYDRIQNYLASQQHEIEGRALIAFVRALPESNQKREFLSILSENAALEVVANEAAQVASRNLDVGELSKGSFGGKLDLRFSVDSRSAVLNRDFTFIDSKGIEWTAPAGFRITGAAIPVAFRDVFGSPFDSDLVGAAALHDYYVSNQQRPWQDTHRMYFEALLASGVDQARAKVFYAAIYRGGPRWQSAQGSHD